MPKFSFLLTDYDIKNLEKAYIKNNADNSIQAFARRLLMEKVYEIIKEENKE